MSNRRINDWRWITGYRRNTLWSKNEMKTDYIGFYSYCHRMDATLEKINMFTIGLQILFSTLLHSIILATATSTSVCTGAISIYVLFLLLGGI